jgi:hypothetical protein
MAKPDPPLLRFSLRSLLIGIALLTPFLALYQAFGVQAVPFWCMWALAIVVGVGLWLKHRPITVVAFALLVISTVSIQRTVERSYLRQDSWKYGGRVASCNNNMKQLVLGLHNYNDRYQVLPNVGSATQPSWRVMILPFIEQQPLFQAYNFQQTWDGPANLPLSRTNISVYHCPTDNAGPFHHTNYLAVTGDDTCWPNDGTVSLDSTDVPDGLSNTLLLAERHNFGIVWSEPRDYAQGDAIAGNHGDHVQYFDGSRRYTGPRSAVVAAADGSTRWISNDIDPEVLKQLTNRRDGKPGDWP